MTLRAWGLRISRPREKPRTGSLTRGLSRLGHAVSDFAGFWATYGIGVWVIAVVVVAVLGYIGFSEHPITGERDVWDRAYLTLQLVVLEGGTPRPPVPWELEVARVAAPALAAIGIVGIASLLVQALTQQNWRVRWVRNHTIICGLGERGSALTKNLCEQKPATSVIAVETGAHAEDVQAAATLERSSCREMPPTSRC